MNGKTRTKIGYVFQNKKAGAKAPAFFMAEFICSP